MIYLWHDCRQCHTVLKRAYQFLRWKCSYNSVHVYICVISENIYCWFELRVDPLFLWKASPKTKIDGFSRIQTEKGENIWPSTTDSVSLERMDLLPSTTTWHETLQSIQKGSEDMWVQFPLTTFVFLWISAAWKLNLECWKTILANAKENVISFISLILLHYTDTF